MSSILERIRYVHVVRTLSWECALFVFSVTAGWMQAYLKQSPQSKCCIIELVLRARPHTEAACQAVQVASAKSTFCQNNH